MFIRCARRVVLPAAGLLASALVVNGTHAWNNYHWARQSNPFTVKLGDNVNSMWDGYLATTSNDWSTSAVLDTTIVPGGSPSKNCRPTSGRVEVCNGTYGFNGWLGIAQIWASGSHISQGAVKLNDSYFNTAKYNNPAWRNLVMCQEVGHTFGLGHNDENFNNTPTGTCMDYSNDPMPNQHPNQHDYEMLGNIYQHLDNTTTVDSSGAVLPHPPAMRDLDVEQRRNWGKLVSSSKNGRNEVYELDFGGGHKIITFVTWADGVDRGRGE